MIIRRALASNQRWQLFLKQIVVKHSTSTSNQHRVEQKSRLLPGPEKIRVSNLLSDSNKRALDDSGGARTIYELFKLGCNISNNGPCLGTRNKETGKYEWITYQETLERSLSVGSGFHQLGIAPGQESIIGINCKNRTEFVLTYLGASTYSSTVSPLYDHLSSEAMNYIIALTEIPLLIVDTQEKAQYVLSQKRHFPKLRIVVVTEEPSKDLMAAGRSVKVDVLAFQDLERLGSKKRTPVEIPNPDDVFLISWTSGTTGQPKGAIISQQNVVNNVNAVAEFMKPISIVQTVGFSYLPTGHMFEVLMELEVFRWGGRLGFFGGDVLNLLDDMKTLQPKFIIVVPRLMNRIYSTIQSTLSKSPVKRLLFNFALRKKEELLKRGVFDSNTIWDRYVFKSIRDIFGGKLEYIISSSAPLDPEIYKFFLCALGCPIFNGYGQTETLALAFSTHDNIDGGNVGVPLEGVEIKLVDVPEMEYFSKDDVGEICARGNPIMRGYFKNPEADKITIDKDGWMHTADIGKWLPDGTLKLVDRKSNLFKLSQGEFISPQKIENTYSKLPLLLQLYVDDHSGKDYLVGVIIPDPTTFIPWAKQKGFKHDTLEDLCRDKEVKLKLLKELHELGKSSELLPLEQIKNLYLHPTPLTIEEGLLTPTLKMKRKMVKKRFTEEIEELYRKPLV